MQRKPSKRIGLTVTGADLLNKTSCKNKPVGFDHLHCCLCLALQSDDTSSSEDDELTTVTVQNTIPTVVIQNKPVLSEAYIISPSLLAIVSCDVVTKIKTE